MLRFKEDVSLRGKSEEKHFQGPLAEHTCRVNTSRGAGGPQGRGGKCGQRLLNKAASLQPVEGGRRWNILKYAIFPRVTLVLGLTLSDEAETFSSPKLNRSRKLLTFETILLDIAATNQP